MTNKSSPKQHGYHHINARRPKSPQYKRNNKAKARIRRAAREKI